MRPRDRGGHREVLVMGSVALLVLIVVGAGAALASREVSQEEALDQSERRTSRIAEQVVAPMLPAYIAGDPEGIESLDAAVDSRVSADDLLKVTVWSADGLVLYSSDPAEIGQRMKISGEIRRALAGIRNSYFEVEDDQPSDDPHTSGAAPGQAYAEIYTPLTGVTGQGPLALEAYYDYERIDQTANTLLWTLLALALVPLVVLQAVQLPISLSLSRRLRRHELERSALLEEALAASDRERARFAADLHDGPIQDLAGIGLALGAVADGVAERHTVMMGRIEEGLLRSVQSLRSLMSDLYPPDLHGDSLAQALESLAQPLRLEGVDVEVTAAPGDLGLDDESALVLYRFAREALANISKHAEATSVQVHLDAVPGRDGSLGVVRLDIVDDGVGFDLAAAEPAEGHLGLRLLVDRIEGLAGRVELATSTGHGMSVRAEVPRRA